MDPHTWVNEGDTPLVTYCYDRDEAASQAVIEAFTAANVEIFDSDVSLHDQMGGDSIDELQWQTGCALTVSVRLWGHSVVITPETVQIYEQAPASARSRSCHE